MGAILIYIRPEYYIKKVLLDATIFSPLENLNKMITELEYNCYLISLPPKCFKDTETKVYITKEQNPITAKLIPDQENQFFLKDPEGILIIPPGAHLKNIFEERLVISFVKPDLQYFIENMSKIFVEDLEIADKCEIVIKPSENSYEDNGTSHATIQLKLVNMILKNLYTEQQNLSRIFTTVGCPIFSAVACALAEVTGKPLSIDRIQSYENGKIIEVRFRIQKIEYEERKAPIPDFIEKLDRSKILFKLPEMILFVLGLSALVWIGQLKWHEMTVLQKSFDYVLLAARTGENIDLGIGMKVIYYFTIGFALIGLSLVIYFRKRGTN